jgi:transcriptional regulator with XRE-family HTH domain
MNIGQRVREAREALGMQRTVLARRVGVAENTIYRIETAKRTPSVELLEKIARELRTEPADLLKEPVPLAEAPREAGPPEKSEEERRSGYLRSWRAFVYKLVRRWEQDPPESSREIAVVLDAMQALLDEGAFERPPDQITTSDEREVSEWLDLSFVFRGIDRLNQIADTVQADAEAERRRAAFREIKGQMVG